MHDLYCAVKCVTSIRSVSAFDTVENLTPDASKNFHI